MSSTVNDPRQPSAAKRYVPSAVPPQDLPVDYSGLIAVVFGIAGVMFRVRTLSFSRLQFCYFWLEFADVWGVINYLNAWICSTSCVLGLRLYSVLNRWWTWRTWRTTSNRSPWPWCKFTIYFLLNYLNFPCNFCMITDLPKHLRFGSCKFQL